MASGMPEHQIQAILDGKRVPPPMGMVPPPPPMVHPQQMVHRPQVLPQPPQGSMEITSTKTTYTRMARKHLSIEALRDRAIEYEFDTVRFPL